MAHLLAFRFQISAPRLMGRRDAVYALGHNNPRVFQSFDLIRIIRHQAHARYPQMPQNRPRQRVIPQVALKPELFVRLHSIGAMILQLIGAQFVHQPDTAAFLMLANDETSPLTGNLPERDLELSPAIAPQAVENVSRQALRVDAQQRWRPVVHVTHLQNYGLLDSRCRRLRNSTAFKTVDPEQSVLGGK